MHDRVGESAEWRKQDGISHIGTKLGYPSDINIKGQQILSQSRPVSEISDTTGK